jgi:hypothetical protein
MNLPNQAFIKPTGESNMLHKLKPLPKALVILAIVGGVGFALTKIDFSKLTSKKEAAVTADTVEAPQVTTVAPPTAVTAPPPNAAVPAAAVPLPAPQAAAPAPLPAPAKDAGLNNLLK